MLAEPYDLECMKRLSGISVKEFYIHTTEIFPDFQEGLSALTFPGLRHIRVSGNLHPIANRAVFVDFLSAHPLVEEIVLLPDEHYQNGDCFLVEGIYEDYDDSNPFFQLYGMSFGVSTRSSSNADSNPTIICSGLNLSTGGSTVEALTYLLSRIGQNYPSVTSLEIETPFWDPVSIRYSEVSSF